MLTTGFEIKDYPFSKAKIFIDKYHKHNIRPQGHKFTLGIFRNKDWDLDTLDDTSMYSGFSVKDVIDEDFDEENWVEESNKLYYCMKTDRYILDTLNGYFVVEPKPSKILNGIAVCGRPVNRYLDDGNTLEITRVCFANEKDADEFDLQMHTKNLDHSSSVASELVAAVCKKAKKLGYSRIITYTRKDENGSYYKAVGFTITNVQKYARVWKSKNAKIINNKSTPQPKIRWEKTL